MAGKRVWVAGHRGMVGSAIVDRLAAEDCEVLTVGRDGADLRRQADVEAWMAANKPHAVFIAAARVGGIWANDTRPAEFIYENLMIEANIVDAAWRNGVEKLLFLGSSCIYPREAPQPMTESALLTGPLEPTNQWYAIAKIAGIKLCQAYRRQYGCDFVSAMPTNLYGYRDNFDLTSSHVLPALMAKIHAAKAEGRSSFEVWGSGRPRREFLFAADAADAMVFLIKNYSGEEHVNVGTGLEVTIRELAETAAQVIGFDGEIVFDSSKPDGAPRKLLDVSALAGLGWTAKTGLREGIRLSYDWYLEHKAPR
ncbi:MAG: GDP-L-fucose synthase [Alphaproteobacteria bacterium]|nr:GDP-L-fucose synthase [Alphaproteobacteria bacterium]MBF0373558.1 GDP-L-fucose synthase [Alphaproteobacteria bacterium]MBF0392742.1 GDP-L-fucose synthase [Alphaproteobacteria bacterium]